MLLICVASVPSSAFAQQRTLVGDSRLQLGTEANLSASVRAGDLDGDGDEDVVVANGRHWPQQNFIFLNNGSAQFSVMRPLGSDRTTSYACELSDLDADGDLDIVVGNDMAPCQIFLNDGRANFSEHAVLDEVSSVRSLTIGDVDGDSDPDILMTCRGRRNLIYFNDGRANFTDKQPFGTLRDSTIDVALADLNLDGKVDLVLANRDQQNNILLINEGAATFRKVTVSAQTSDTRAVVVADFNSDGKPDCAFGNIDGSNSIYFGTGTGEFEERIEFSEPTRQTYALAAADLDLDGDIDLVAGNVLSRNEVFFNQGDGRTFIREEFGPDGSMTYGICVADFNGDRYPDVAVANSGTENLVFLNRPAPPNSEQTSTSTTQIAPGEQGSVITDEFQATDIKDLSKAAQLPTTQWPMFRGEQAQGVSYGFALPQSWNADTQLGDEQNILWRAVVPGLAHSSPVVVDERVFLATAVAEQGEPQLQIGPGGAPTAADDDGVQQWKIMCYDKRTGDELWSQTAHMGIPRATRHIKATHASTTLAVDGDHVVAFFGSEGLYCYDLDGQLKWRRNLGVINISKYGIGWGYASSPAIYDGRIVLVCDDPSNPYVVALSLSTGEELWRVGRQGDCERSWGTPLIHRPAPAEPAQVVVNGWPAVIAYNLDDGQEMWRIRGGGDNPIPSPFVADGHIFVTSAHGSDSPIHAIRMGARGDLSEKTQTAPNDAFLWSVPRGGSYMSTPVVLGDYLYLGNSNGILRCFNARTGEKAYEERLGTAAGIIASLVAGDDKVYCASEDGHVYVVAAGPRFNLLAKNAMGNPCFATPAISGGIMYFRTTRELIAIHETSQ